MPKRLFLLLVLIFATVGAAGWTIANAAVETKTLDRDLEPVVVEGAKVTSLIGAPVEHLFVYTYTGADWEEQIPVQVDEVTASGNYTTTEDGLLDANDEIVFMVKDLGDRAPDTALLTATLSISDTWYEIEVTDPLSPTKKGWAYLVRSSVLAPTFSGDYVSYNDTTERITTSQYVLGFATAEVPTPYFGLNYLALDGGADILDRSKLRVGASVFGIPVTFTEEDLTDPETTLIKDGAVRVLVQQTANANFAGQQQTLYKAYGSLIQGTANINLGGGSGLVSSVRTSMDLVSTVPPTTIFYNANTIGVVVDGTADTVAETPLSNWTQISYPNGRLIQVGDPTPASGTPKSFYRDNSTPESNDTGEPGSYGDSGFLVTGNINEMFAVKSMLFILPPGLDNEGETYEGYFFNTLRIQSGFQGAPAAGPVFLPIVLKGS